MKNLANNANKESQEFANSKIVTTKSYLNLIQKACHSLDSALEATKLNYSEIRSNVESLVKLSSEMSTELQILLKSIPFEKELSSTFKGGFNLLVVDDNSTNRKVLSHLLRKRGHAIYEAENGQIACDIVSKGGIDGVFMDLAMPILNGIDATIFIREKLDLSIFKLPIFAVSAYTMTETQDACFQVGMNGFIAKPVSAADIASAIDIISQLRTTSVRNVTSK